LSFRASNSLIQLADIEVGARFVVPGTGRLGRRVVGPAAASGELPCELNANSGPGTERVHLRARLLVQPMADPPPDPVGVRAA
jgi:hypothetical protein